LRRELAYTGAAAVDLPSLHTRAGEAADTLLTLLESEQVVLWVDNWYCQRYGVNPEFPCRSMDVTAMAMLVLSSTATATPAGRTRSRMLPAFPGQRPLSTVIGYVGEMATSLSAVCDDLLRAVQGIAAVAIQPSWIRVPLDLSRHRGRSLQWRSLTLSEHRVSANTELLNVLTDVCGLQQRAGRVLPLLIDEKVFYAVCRLLYSKVHASVDCALWLRHVPLLFGVWHAYKHTLTLVYRRFFALFALVELTGCPALGASVRCQRKVMYMEKVVATLLLCSDAVRGQLVTAIASTVGQPTQRC
jgi:hypothetical protein